MDFTARVAWHLGDRFRIWARRSALCRAASEDRRRTVRAAGLAVAFGGLPASLVRFFFGSIIGILLGVAFGTLLAVSRGVDRSVSPTFHALRQVAIFAWVPLLTAWLGMGESAKIVFIALAAFKSMSMNTYQGARHVPPHYVEVGRALCFSRWGMFSRVVLPAALPSILTGIRLALLHAWAATVGVEYLLGLGDGVGVLLTEGSRALSHGYRHFRCSARRRGRPSDQPGAKACRAPPRTLEGDRNLSVGSGGHARSHVLLV